MVQGVGDLLRSILRSQGHDRAVNARLDRISIQRHRGLDQMVRHEGGIAGVDRDDECVAGGTAFGFVHGNGGRHDSAGEGVQSAIKSSRTLSYRTPRLLKHA